LRLTGMSTRDTKREMSSSLWDMARSHDQTGLYLEPIRQPLDVV
jgi:hypothetical protein